MDEFDIIEHYFGRFHSHKRDDVLLGIGDDAAIINVPDDSKLLISTDTLVSGVHFLVETLPEDIAYKALAVNLSDMAAMGAEPRWLTLSLTVPEYKESWFKQFAHGFNQLANDYSLALVGGDMTRGPLSVTVQVHGLIPKNTYQTGIALRRQGARPGDLIYVTGKLGSATFALQSLLNKDNVFKNPSKAELARLNRPEARIATGLALRGIATSCIDISDGLLGDLKQVLRASKVGAEIEISKIPYSDSLLKLDNELAIELALTGGDDYELCFTLPDSITPVEINHINSHCEITHIGQINEQDSVFILKKEDGKEYPLDMDAYQHFS